MAGGTITRIALGNSITDVEENFDGFYQNLTMNAGKENKFSAKTTNYGNPKQPATGKKHIIRGWWTDENNIPISEALLGDTVKFHVETDGIDGKPVELILFDDDTQDIEHNGGAGNDKITLYPSYNDEAALHLGESRFENAVNNKIVKTIILSEYFGWLADQEEDKTVELFFICKYGDEKENLPIQFHDYLKVKGMPKIIFVNGQWKLASRVPFGMGENFGPTEPKKPYWSQGIGNNSIDYFNVRAKYKYRNQPLDSKFLEDNKYLLYYDGSSNWGLDQSGNDRFTNGRKFAEESFDEITKGLGKNEVFLVSHSEGGAFAAGMADYLHEKGIKIGEHILLSPDEGDEFTINPEIPSYQLTYMFFSSVWNPMGTIVNSEKQRQFNKQFRRWGKYYAIVDWVTNEFRVQGTKKMGIAHVQDSGWEGVHGWTNSNRIFNKITDLKEVNTYESIGSKDGEFYSGRDHNATTNGTIFYRIDDEYISVKCPPIAEIK